MSFSTFQQYIDTLIEKHHLESYNPKQRFAYLKQLATQLSLDENITTPVIQIAGTNGKGSVQHILWKLLKADGYQCHVFKSPHLIKINERFILNNEMIDNETLLTALQFIDTLTTQPIGFFALLTLAFYHLCMLNKADFILVETGLGGELDATNILQDHALSIITSINYDHCEVLGDTLTAIASAKAGIMRGKKKCFADNQLPEAETVLRQVAKDTNCQLSLLTDEAFGHLTNGFRIANHTFPPPNLAGKFQKNNAALAILAYQHLSKAMNALNITQIGEVLSQLNFDGRFQLIKCGLLKNKIKHTLYLDGAHNPPAIQALTEHLQTIHKPIYIWLSIKANKDHQSMIQHLLKVSKFILIQVDNESDRIKQQQLLNHDNISFCESIDKAIKQLNQLPDGILVACGSLHWVGELLKLNSKHHT